MASVNKVQDIQIRMFKWNEKLHKVKESQGLFMFRVKNPKKEDRCVLVVFDLAWLSTRDGTERLVTGSIEGIRSFSEDTTERFRKAVSSHLLSCFQFNIERAPQTRNSTILIVVDVYEYRTMKCTRKRAYSSAFPLQKQALEDANDDEKRQVRDARSYRKDLLSWIQKKSCVDDVSPTGSEVKKRKVGDARSYKKELMYRTQRNLFFSEVEEIRHKIRSLLQEPMVEPIATDELKGLCKVEAAVKVQEFYGCEPVDVCSICLDGVSRGVMVAETPCKHFFHRDCLFQWLPNTSCCPLCRSFCATIIQ